MSDHPWEAPVAPCLCETDLIIFAKPKTALAYETLALNHRKTLSIEPNEESTDESHPYYKNKNGFALLWCEKVSGTVGT